MTIVDDIEEGSWVAMITTTKPLLSARTGGSRGLPGRQMQQQQQQQQQQNIATAANVSHLMSDSENWLFSLFFFIELLASFFRDDDPCWT